MELRAGPAGEQERREWLDALQDVKERITTVENTQRSHANSIAGNAALIDRIKVKLENTDDDIVNYKTYIQGCLYSDTTSVENSFKVLDAKVYEFTKLLTDVLQVKMTATDDRLEAIQAKLDEMNSKLNAKEDRADLFPCGDQHGAQRFDIQAASLPTPKPGESAIAEEIYVGRPVKPQDLQMATAQSQQVQTSPFVPGQIVEQQPARDPLQENDGWKKYLESQRNESRHQAAAPNQAGQDGKKGISLPGKSNDAASCRERGAIPSSRRIS